MRANHLQSAEALIASDSFAVGEPIQITEHSGCVRPGTAAASYIVNFRTIGSKCEEGMKSNIPSDTILKPGRGIDLQNRHIHIQNVSIYHRMNPVEYSVII